MPWKKGSPPLYPIWMGMKQRCYNKKSTNFKNYGGRGIIVCEQWIDDYHQFSVDMGPRPKGMWIERKDNNGNYEPTNCYWATPIQQGRNKRNTQKVIIEGVNYKAIELAEKSGVKSCTIIRRAKIGLKYDDIVALDKVFYAKPPSNDHYDINILKKAARMAAAIKRSKTHCKYGHEYTPENTAWYYQKSSDCTFRVCRLCDMYRCRLRTRKKRHKRMQEKLTRLNAQNQG